MPNDNIEDIEQRLEQRRQDTAATINALEAKLSPGQLLDQVMTSVKSNGGDLVRNLGDQIKQNPLGVALIGAGIAMMATSRPQYTSEPEISDDDEFESWRESQEGEAYYQLSEAERSAVRSVGETDDAYTTRLYRTRASAVGIEFDHDDNDASAERSFREKVDAKVNAIKARASEKREEIAASARRRKAEISARYDGLKASAKHHGATARDEAHARASAAKNQAQDLYHQNPLTAGLVALAAGALVGGGLPPVVTPDSKYGGDLARKAQDKARDAKAQAQAKADAKAHELAEEAQRKVEQA